MVTMPLSPKVCSRLVWTTCLSAALLLAADPRWKTKPAATWNESDTKEILGDSAWAKIVKATIIRKQSEDERRQGGNMGDAKGVGYDGLEKDKVRVPKSIMDFIKPEPPAPPRPQMPVLVRWESAEPIRLAEFRSGGFEPPTIEEGGYMIAVYGIPTANVKGDPKTIGEPIRENAYLRREGQKDVRPVACEVFQLEDSMVALFTFPASAEITKKDMRVEFAVLIGRISVTKDFNLDEMSFQGKLAL